MHTSGFPDQASSYLMGEAAGVHPRLVADGGADAHQRLPRSGLFIPELVAVVRRDEAGAAGTSRVGRLDEVRERERRRGEGGRFEEAASILWAHARSP